MASNTSQSAVSSSHHSSYLCQIWTYSGYDGNQRPRPWGTLPNFRSPSTGCYPVFLLFLNLFHPIARKWGTKSWFHQLSFLMSIFSGLQVILIHPTLFVKKPTRSPLNSLQWIHLPRIKLPSETSPKHLRDGEIGFAGYPQKRAETRSFMIWTSA